MFVVSRVLWTLLMPENLFLLLLLLAAVLLRTRLAGTGRCLVLILAVAGAGLAVLPARDLLVLPLEARFPAEPRVGQVDGIVVLGGSQLPRLTEAWGRPALNDAAERLTEFVRLARRYPEARLVFSGGSGDLLRPDLKETSTARLVFEDLGLSPSRVLFEDRSRNTEENALFSRLLADPKPGETWLLVTSARHMPRAVGLFRKAGWEVVPNPVDHTVLPWKDLQLHASFAEGLAGVTDGVREWGALVVCWMTGKTSELFPGP